MCLRLRTPGVEQLPLRLSLCSMFCFFLSSEFPKPVSLLPSLTPGGKKSRELIGGSSCRKKKLSETPPDLLTPTDGGAAAEGGQSRESLRWEGVLEDREAEERRLEVYRANRRRRYVAHREAEDGGGRRREGTGTDSGQSRFNTDQKELNFY